FFVLWHPLCFCSLSLHDALPIYLLGTGELRCSSQDLGDGTPLPSIARKCRHEFSTPALGEVAAGPVRARATIARRAIAASATTRSEEHTSELQSRFDLVCRLLLE